jgi:hypothetical protein
MAEEAAARLLFYCFGSERLPRGPCTTNTHLSTRMQVSLLVATSGATDVSSTLRMLALAASFT